MNVYILYKSIYMWELIYGLPGVYCQQKIV